MRRVAIIDYGSGNLRSVSKAFEAVGAQVRVTAEARELADATHIVLPGVGAFADCMRGLNALPGMLDEMRLQTVEGGKPFLGICVGMQMLFERGHEHGVHEGLSWMQGEVKAIEPAGEARKIPHMGWNVLNWRGSQKLAEGLRDHAHAYFVHGYHVTGASAPDVAAITDYGQELVAVVAKDNIMGTQFHPEKSQQTGLTLLANFLKVQ